MGGALSFLIGVKVFDQHSLAGAVGTGASIVLQNVNVALSIAVALVTLAYMIVKLTNEIKKGKKNGVQRADPDKG